MKKGDFTGKKKLDPRVVLHPKVLLTPVSEFTIIITAVPQLEARRPPGKELILLSGLLTGLLVDHMLVPAVNHWLFLPADNAQEEGDKEEEEAAGQCQADDDFWRGKGGGCMK